MCVEKKAGKFLSVVVLVLLRAWGGGGGGAQQPGNEARHVAVDLT